jgi:hypothetical protein
VNNFADFFLAIAGVIRQFSPKARQIKKIPIVSQIRNALCLGVNNFSHAGESIALD